ncbi:hypothetical protein ACFL1R_09195 [Candidatus Latescibacterota bacterium]
MENDHLEYMDNREEQPPFFSSWTHLYILVFSNLLILIILFYVFTKVFD